MIRQIRKEVMMRIRRSAESDETNEDEKKHLEDQVQEVTNEVNSKIEMMGKRKEEELMTV